MTTAGSGATLQGRTAVVTGAASGIGRAICRALAGRGVHLAMADIDAAGLAETMRLATTLDVRISCHQLDVADRAAIAGFPAVVLAAHPGVDILVNNAGVALGGSFEQVRETDFEWLFEINFWGVVRMTRAFLPLLRASNQANLVNLSSLYGLVSPAGQSAYSASKFAVRGFSNALRAELKNSRIAVTVVHPGGVATSIADNARAAPDASPEEVARGKQRANSLLRMPPKQAGEIIVRAMERRQPRVLVGRDAKFVALFERLAPIRHARLFERAG